MQHKTIVKINIDPAKKIAELYGIGPKLAEKIVKYRETEGYFIYPEDLAKINGISLDLAIAVSPYIDWEIPDEISDSVKRDSTSIAFLVAFLILVLGFFRYKTYTSLMFYLKNSGYPIELWMCLSITSLLIFLFIHNFLMLLNEFSTTNERRYHYSKEADLSIIPIVLSIVSLGISNFIYYQYKSPNGWQQFFKSPASVLGFFGGLFGLFSFLPMILGYFFPSLRTNRKISFILNLSVVTTGPILAYAIWIFRVELPFWLLLLTGLVGIYYIYIGFLIIRYDLDPLFSFFDYFEYIKKDKKANWISWLNSRLPNIEDQKALKVELDKTYPISKSRTFFGMVIIGAGGWLIVTVIQAVIQWIIERGLNRLWP
jgi:competence ComEA-like helix-hairpin-helix protein